MVQEVSSGIGSTAKSSHIPKVSGVTDDGFRSRREIVPEQCDDTGVGSYSPNGV